jgi:hypothetical protein
VPGSPAIACRRAEQPAIQLTSADLQAYPHSGPGAGGIGYRVALEDSGIDPDERLIRRDVHSEFSALQTTWELFSKADAPTAIFTAQNLLTIGARLALQRMGAERTVAHVGFDDQHAHPRLRGDPPT